MVLAGRGKVNHLLNPLQAEIIACLRRIQMAITVGAGYIILETDAQEVVKAIRSSCYDDSTLGHLFHEAKALLALNFIQFECVFVARECNRAAHELAVRGSLCNEGEEVVSIHLPQSMDVIVAKDLLASYQ